MTTKFNLIFLYIQRIIIAYTYVVIHSLILGNLVEYLYGYFFFTALKVKLQNIEDNVPNKDVFNTIASTISALQLYKGLTVEQIVRGDITEVEPLQRLTLADAFAIAQTAYEKDDMFYAIEWMKYIIEEVKSHRISDIDDKVSSSAIFHMLSNAYFRVSND